MAFEITLDFSEFIARAKQVINSPGLFFEKLKKEKGYQKALIYALLLWAIGSLLLALSKIVLGYAIPSLFPQVRAVEQIQLPQVIATQLINAFFSTFFGVLYTGFIALVLHLWIKLFRGKGTFVKTFQLAVYFLTPTLLFGWAPIADFVAGLYSIYLLILGAQKLHDLPKRRTWIMFVVIPLIALFVISILLAQFLQATPLGVSFS